MRSAVTLPAHAKVNLHLAILGKRPDGYHELLTLFERVDLADEVTVEKASGGGIHLACESPEVPQDATNLAARAAAEFRAASGWNEGLRIRLQKRIPAGGGLGGGSSDAAAVLLALQEVSGGALSEEQMLGCSARLGSDVPFFVSRQPWAIGRGRGEKIEPVRLDASLWHLLVTPDFSVPTRSVYEAFRSAGPSVPAGQGPAAGALTAIRPDVTLLLRALEQRRISEARELLFNALEPTVETLYPAIRGVKEAMQAAGLERPCVSGSGSTLFALCDSSAQAEEAAQRIRREHPAWRVLTAVTA